MTWLVVIAVLLLIAICGAIVVGSCLVISGRNSDIEDPWTDDN